MYTNTSKFRVNGKYGLFTIPKGILDEAGWKPGNLMLFWGLDNGQVIHIEKISEEYLKELGKDYNKKIYKKIANFGGGTGTCGIKSLPEFLMREFKPKNGQIIYFLPARYSWFRGIFPENVVNNIIFAAFNPKHLKEYEKTEQENKEKLKEELLLNG